jgi:hypothetical protein
MGQMGATESGGPSSEHEGPVEILPWLENGIVELPHTACWQAPV